MSKLTENIHSFENYQKEFATWEATEQTFDDNKAFWMMRKPGSQYQKVCLYRDGCNMFIYGDYGQFTFDSVTWKGDVYNLEYDNNGYQMEKLSYDSKQSLNVFDDEYCREDILDWLKDRLEQRYDLDEKDIKKVVEWIEESGHDFDDFDIEEFCDKNDLSDIDDILNFTRECFRSVDEYEWIAFLRNNTNELQEFDEVCESWLWNAGKRINQRYFICMYALQVCGEKLKAQQEKE